MNKKNRNHTVKEAFDYRFKEVISFDDDCVYISKNNFQKKKQLKNLKNIIKNKVQLRAI